jgi:hypothetical protein
MSPLRTKLSHARVKNIAANLITNRVKITFECYLDEEMLEAKRTLALLSVDEAPVDLVITELQMKLPGLHAPPHSAPIPGDKENGQKESQEQNQQ